MFPFCYIKMSQAILKLANGDKVDSNKLKENPVIWGSNQYKYSDFENAVMNNNFDSYLQKQGIEGKDAEEIRGYLNSYLQGFKEGKIRRNVDGTYAVSDESLITDSNPARRGLFGKIRGDKKRIALAYFNNVFNSLSPHNSSQEDIPNTAKQSFTYGYGKQLRKNIFKDNNESDAEKEIWYANENKWDTALNALNNYRESLTGDYDFSSTSFKDKNEYLNALAEVEAALKSKNLDSLKQSLYNAGEADLYSLFMNKADYDYSRMTPEQRQAAEEQARIKTQQLEDELGEMTESERIAEEDSPEHLAKMEELERKQAEEAAKKEETKATIRDLFRESSVSGISEPWTPNHKNIQIRPPLKIGNWVIPGQPIIEKGSLQDKRIEATNAVANKIKDLFIDFFIKKQEKPSYYYKNGGIVKAQSGAALYNPAAKSIRNTSMNSSYNRDRDLLKSEETLNYLRSLNRDNYMQFNGYEDLYDNNYTSTYGEGSLNNWGTQSLSNIKFDPKTKRMQFVWNSRGLNNPIFKGFTGVGNSGDRPNLGEDGRFGNMTIQRTLGRGISDEIAQLYNTELNKNGLKFYKATHGGWRIRPMAQQPSKENIQPNLDNSSLNGSTSETFSKIKDISGNEINPSKLPNIRLSSENIGDLRFGLTQWFNNRQKYSPQIALTDAPTLYSKVQYNLPMEMFYQNAANKFRRLGARAATSDSVRNFAQQLEAESAAVGQEERGRLANLDTYNTTSQRAQEVQNTNTLSRIQNANQNKLRMASAQEAKAAFERAKGLKRGQNLANWLFGKQQRLEGINEWNRNLDLETARNKWSQIYNNELSPYEIQLANAKTPEEQLRIRRAMTEKAREITNRGYEDIMARRRKPSVFLKKGGSLSFGERVALQNIREYNKKLLQDKKEFNKLLRLSITEGNKTIRGISNYSASLIKNSLKL